MLFFYKQLKIRKQARAVCKKLVPPVRTAGTGKQSTPRVKLNVARSCDTGNQFLLFSPGLGYACKRKHKQVYNMHNLYAHIRAKSLYAYVQKSVQFDGVCIVYYAYKKQLEEKVYTSVCAFLRHCKPRQTSTRKSARNACFKKPDWVEISSFKPCLAR